MAGSSAPQSAVIVARDLWVRRGDSDILSGVDLQLDEGTVTGLLGPSGCGKTTLMRCIVGLQRPSGGEISVLGLAAGDPRLRSRVGYVTQAPAVYDDLTVRQNLRYFAGVLGARGARVDEVARTVELVARLDRRVAVLSGGERARLSLASALLSEPAVLVLDEPTAGLDPLLREALWGTFRSLADRGAALLVSSHVMEEADYCDRLLLMREGRILAAGSPTELRGRTGEDDMTRAFIQVISAGRPLASPQSDGRVRRRAIHPAGRLRSELPSTRRTLMTAGRVFAQLRHDPLTLALVAAIPILLLALMRWVFPGPATFQRIAVPMLGIFPFMSMFIVTSVTLLRERTSGTLERLMAMPLARVDLVLGYLGAFAAASVVQVAVATAFGFAVLDIDSSASPAWVGLAAVGAALVGTGLGLFASVIARTEFQAVLWMALIVLPQVILCGLLVPRSEMARALEIVSALLPLTYAFDMLDRLGDGRIDGTALWVDTLVLAGSCALATLAASATLRRSSR